MATAIVTKSTSAVVNTPKGLTRTVATPAPTRDTYQAMPDPYCVGTWKVAPQNHPETGIIYHFSPHHDLFYGDTAENRARAWAETKNAQRVN